MKATKYTVQGAVGTRKSPRAYTHAVVAEINYIVKLSRALLADNKNERDNFQFYATCAGMTVGDIYPGFKFGINQDLIQRGQELIAKYGSDFATFRANKNIEIARKIEAEAAADKGVVHVLQWSQSERNAVKAAQTWAKSGYYKNVRVAVTTAN